MNHREQLLMNEFIQGVGRRALLLTAQFPFLFIGEILAAFEDYIQIDVEVTHTEQLEKRIWTLHIGTVNAFYIERPGLPPIPRLGQGSQ